MIVRLDLKGIIIVQNKGGRNIVIEAFEGFYVFCCGKYMFEESICLNIENEYKYFNGYFR